MLEPREYATGRENILANRTLRAKFNSLKYDPPKVLIPVTYITPPREPLAAIVREICESFQISKAHLFGRSHAPAYAIPRLLAMAMLSRASKLSSTRIGQIFHRDHTSALHAIWTKGPLIVRVAGELAPDHSIRDLVQALRIEFSSLPKPPKPYQHPTQAQSAWNGKRVPMLKELIGKELTHSQIARVMGVSTSAVSHICRRLGLRRKFS